MGSAQQMRPLRLVGRCELFGEIDSGGMATVHMGRLRAVGGFAKIVAIKRMHKQFAKDPQFVAMFLDEARLVARIKHPNVLATLDVIEEEGELFIVMEYVPSATLRELVSQTARRGEGIPMRIALQIVTSMLHGLNAAHEAKSPSGEALELVHRDVSPENILIGTDGVSRLLDFGMARALDRLHVTEVGQVKGKLSVMAPEQVQGQPVTRHTDVFASGVVLWQALTGRRLLKGEHMAEIANNVIHQKFEPPSSIVADLPKKLDSIVMRALERDPEKRWQSAEKMALALEAVGDLASQRAVGQWVEKIAWEKLAQRAKMVAAIEATPLGLEVSDARAPLITADDEVVESVDLERASDSRLAGAQKALSAVWSRSMAATRSALGDIVQRRTSGKVDVPGTMQHMVRQRPLVTGGVALFVAVSFIALVLSLSGDSDDDAADGSAASDGLTPRQSFVAGSGVPKPATSSAPEAAAGSDKPAADRITVPGGDFLQGCNTFADRACGPDERPGRKVKLAAFALDRTEVTVTMYRACVAAKACDEENLDADGTALAESDKCNYGRDGREKHPVNCVSHDQASAYCKWAGGRLPSEAQWEKAAGGSDAWPFPSGDQSIDCDKAVMSDKGDGCSRGTTWAVGSKPGGASPYGALDMAGNVWEWVADWYGPTYYRDAPTDNPTGPDEGAHRVIRGGGWRDAAVRLLRTSARSKLGPNLHSMVVGFRCAYDAK